MPTDILDLARPAPRDRTRKNTTRLIRYEQFEPFYLEIRRHFNCSAEDAMRLIGYSGGTMLAEWRRVGTPLLAKNAARGVLVELELPQPPLPLASPEDSEPDFSFEELADIFALLRGFDVAAPARKALVAKVARLLAEETEE